LRTVAIFGAGATLSEAIAYRPKQTREHPPLDASFFGKTVELEDRHSLVRSAVRRLRSVIRTDGSFDDPWSARSPITLEQFFADVYYDVASSRSSSAFRVYLALLNLYGHVLGATTNWITSRTRSGLLIHLLRREVRIAAPNALTIITFNQDLVLENTVRRLCHDDERWCLRGLYGDLDFNPLFSRRDEVLPHHSATCRHNSPITLLKLHGSLNWTIAKSRC
jgi:hypothetical protein